MVVGSILHSDSHMIVDSLTAISRSSQCSTTGIIKAVVYAILSMG